MSEVAEPARADRRRLDADALRAAGSVACSMSGVPGVARRRVTVIGGGVAGANAGGRSPLGMGADVDRSSTPTSQRLRYLDDHFQGRVKTAASNPLDLDRAVVSSDLAHRSRCSSRARRPPSSSPTSMVGAHAGRARVLVDIARRPGRLLRGHRIPTTHADPTFPVHGSIFYCVANMPGAGAEHRRRRR